jgi:hypothetical protein
MEAFFTPYGPGDWLVLVLCWTLFFFWSLGRKKFIIIVSYGALHNCFA